jgi:hypothetical protein
MGRLPACVPRITTSRRVVFRGCRYFVMFRPPSLLAPQIVPTAAILPQGRRGFYVRAYRALLPPHAPNMLTVRRQVIDGTGTCTLLDSQPCRLLQYLDHLFIFSQSHLRQPFRRMSHISTVGVSIDRLVNARPVIRQSSRSELAGPTARLSQSRYSAGSITFISMRHNGLYFCALQAVSADTLLCYCGVISSARGAGRK